MLRYGSHSFTCKLHPTCLYLVSVHQMAPPQTEKIVIIAAVVKTTQICANHNERNRAY